LLGLSFSGLRDHGDGAAMQWRRRALYLIATIIIVPIIVAVVVYLVR
jgi:hypothetical protein